MLLGTVGCLVAANEVEDLFGDRELPMFSSKYTSTSLTERKSCGRRIKAKIEAIYFTHVQLGKVTQCHVLASISIVASP